MRKGIVAFNVVAAVLFLALFAALPAPVEATDVEHKLDEFEKLSIS